MCKLSNGNIVTGYYGKDGVMSDGWDSKYEAIEVFNAYYKDNEDAPDAEVIEYNGKWVIAY
jgi:hypothetical protein